MISINRQHALGMLINFNTTVSALASVT